MISLASKSVNAVLQVCEVILSDKQRESPPTGRSQPPTYRILVSALVTGTPISYLQLLLFIPQEDTDTGNAAVIHSITGET